MRTIFAIAAAILLTTVGMASATLNNFKLRAVVTGSGAYGAPLNQGNLGLSKVITITYTGNDGSVYSQLSSFTTLNAGYNVDTFTTNLNTKGTVPGWPGQQYIQWTVTPSAPGFTFTPTSIVYNTQTKDTNWLVETLTPMFIVTDVSNPTASVTAQPNASYVQGDSARISILAKDNSQELSRISWYTVPGWACFHVDSTGPGSGIGWFGGWVYPGPVLDTNITMSSVVPVGTALVKRAIAVVVADFTSNKDTIYTDSFTVVDTTKPVVHLTSPKGGDTAGGTWDAGSAHTIIWTASDNTSLASVQVSVTTNGTTWSTIYTGSGTSVQWTAPTLSTSALRFAAKATDGSGNVRTDTTGAISVADLTPPTVAITDMYLGQEYAIGMIFSVSWTASDNVGVVSYKVSCSHDGGSTWGSLDSAAGNPGNTGWLTLPGPVTTQAVMRVDVWDAAGHNAHSQSGVFAVVAASAPTVSILDIYAGLTLQIGIVDNIFWTASDNVGVVSYKASYSHDGGTTWVKLDSAAGNPGASRTWTIPGPATTQARYKIDVWNAAGLSASSISSQFTVTAAPDTTKPTASFSGKLQDLPEGAPCTVRWTSSDNVGVEKTLLFVYSTAWTKVDSGNGTMDSATWQGSMTPGVYKFQVRVYDAAGNADTVASDSFHVLKPTSVAEASARLPKALGLTGSRTGVTVAMDVAKAATFQAWDMAGRLVVRTAFDQVGWHSVSLPEGVWLARLTCGGRTLRTRVTVW